MRAAEAKRPASDEAILAATEAGVSQRQLAAALGLRGPRIAQIVARARQAPEPAHHPSPEP